MSLTFALEFEENAEISNSENVSNFNWEINKLKKINQKLSTES